MNTFKKIISKKTFIIAEIGNNHEGSLDRALKLIKMAKKSGADAVKIQLINPEKLIHPSNNSRIQQLKKFQLQKNHIKKIISFCQSENIIFFATPFDTEMINFLNKYVELFKVASGDNDNFILIDKLLETNKYIIISTGMQSKSQLNLLVKYIKQKKGLKYFSNKIYFLNCVSNYPTTFLKSNIFRINYLKKMTNNVGYSDHTIGNESSIYSVILGAKIIEKHFTDNNKRKKFRDHSLSANPKQFLELVNSIRDIENIKSTKEYLEDKNNIISTKRSLYAIREIKKGEIINYKNSHMLRPKSKKQLNESIKKIYGTKSSKKYKKGDLILSA